MSDKSTNRITITTPDLGTWSDQLQERKKPTEQALEHLASMSTDELTDYMQTTSEGVSAAEAARRRALVGPNILDANKPPAWWQLLMAAVVNPFNLLLGALAIISVGTPPPQWSTFIILMVMIAVSCGVRFWQEYKCNRQVIRLMGSVSTRVGVLRPAGPALTDVADLVPGDIVELRPGDVVPADCVVVSAAALTVSQSALTGESEPLCKRPSGPHADKSVPLFDCAHLLFMSTGVIAGSARACVVRTGRRTYLATIMTSLKQSAGVTAFKRGIRNVSYMLIGFMVVMVSVVLVIRGKLSGDWGQAALFSLSVAVGVTPEMLPAIVNTNLARGAALLSRNKAIPKRLDAVQNLGAMDVLCSDKTGTLTKDQIDVHSVEAVDGGDDGAAHVLALALTDALGQGSATNGIDDAIVRRAGGKHACVGAVRAAIPFSFEKRRSAVVAVQETGQRLLIVKGAFEEILALSTGLDRGARAGWEQRCRAQNDAGLRVLGVATAPVGPAFEPEHDAIDALPHGLAFAGALTFLDPPKDDAAASLARLRELGVRVKVLTGDNPGIAAQVWRSMGMAAADVEAGVRVVTGAQLDALVDEAAFAAAAQEADVFAKLTPAQKGRLVRCLRAQGHTVGMLGDGVNDSVALRAADVGISVDSGTNVAKDCADVVLTRKELGIIVDCVLAGRVTHGNSIKYIKMVASSNVGNVFSILIASAWLPYEPMTSLQILIQNLLYDVSQLALPWDRMDAEFVLAPQQWRVWDLLRFTLVFAPTSSTIDMCTFALDWFYYGIRSADSPLVARAQTHWFLEGLLTQTLIVHLLRTAKVPFFQTVAARPLLVSTALIMAIGLAVPYIPPVARALEMVHPAPSFLGFLAAELLAYCVEVQLIKMVYIRLFGVWL